MAPFLKDTHNLIAYLTKSPDHPQYDAIIDLLIHSQYHTALTLDPPIYVDALKQFWDNAIVIEHDQIPTSILTKINETPFNLTPAMLSQHLHLDDTDGVSTFTGGELHATFVECDYQGQLDHATIFKRYFGPAHKFLFHTILQTLSPKTTGWDQMPLGSQKLFHSVIQNKKYRASNYFFTELVLNVRAQNTFCLYPRFVMQCLIAELGNATHIGHASKSKFLTAQIFSRMNTPAHTLPTSDDQGNKPIPKEPTSTTIKKKPQKSKAKSQPISKSTKKPKKVSQGDEVPEKPVAAPRQQTQTTVETSSQQLVPPPPIQTPQSSSQQEVVVSPRDTTSLTDPSLDDQLTTHSPTGTQHSPTIPPNSPFTTTLQSLDSTFGLSTGSPHTTSLEMPLQTSDQQVSMLTHGDEDVIPFTSSISELNQTADAAIAHSGSTELFDDYSYIFKTSAVAITNDVVLCTSEVRSPQYQEQGAHDKTGLNTGHDESGSTRDSGDSISLDDESKLLIKELTAKFTSLESEVAILKQMVADMAQVQVHHTPTTPMMASSLEDQPKPSTTTQPPATSASHPDPTHLITQLTTILINHQQTIAQTIQDQRTIITNHLQNHLDSRYNEIKRLISDTHRHFEKATGITPPTPWFPSAEDEAKKGEKDALLAQAKSAKGAIDATESQKKKILNKLAKDVAANRERHEQQHAEERRLRNLQSSELPPLPPFSEIMAQAAVAGHIPADIVTTADSAATTDVYTMIAQTTDEPPVAPKADKSVVIKTTDTQTADSVPSAVTKTTTPVVHTSVVPISSSKTTDEEDNIPISQVLKKRKRKLIIQEEEPEQLSSQSNPLPVQEPSADPSQTNLSIISLEDYTDEELLAKERQAIEESVMEYLTSQGYTGKTLEDRYNEEVDRLVQEAEAQYQIEGKRSQVKRKLKAKPKSTISENKKKQMIEEIISADLGTRASVIRWGDKRLIETYKDLIQLRKKFPEKFPTPSSTALTTSQSQIYEPHTKQPLPPGMTLEQYKEEYKKRDFKIFADLMEDEKILLTDQRDTSEFGIAQTTIPKGSQRSRRKVIHLPTLTITKPTKSNVVITELTPSPSSTTKSKPKPQTKSPSQSKAIINPGKQSLSKIVKWSLEKRTNWMLLTREDGLMSIHKNWYDLLGLQDSDLRTLMNLEIEGEEFMSKAKQFEMELKGQIRQRFQYRK